MGAHSKALCKEWEGDRSAAIAVPDCHQLPTINTVDLGYFMTDQGCHRQQYAGQSIDGQQQAVPRADIVVPLQHVASAYMSCCAAVPATFMPSLQNGRNYLLSFRACHDVKHFSEQGSHDISC